MKDQVMDGEILQANGTLFALRVGISAFVPLGTMLASKTSFKQTDRTRTTAYTVLVCFYGDVSETTAGFRNYLAPSVSVK